MVSQNVNDTPFDEDWVGHTGCIEIQWLEADWSYIARMDYHMGKRPLVRTAEWYQQRRPALRNQFELEFQEVAMSRNISPIYAYVA